MTTITTPTTERTVRDRHPASRSRALSARRWFLVVSPVLAGALAVVAAYADPAPGQTGPAMYEAYAAEHWRLQIKSLAFHWSYAFWIAPALLVVPYVRGRGAWLANVTAVVGFAGMTTLPGLLFVDWYDSAIGKEFGADGVVAVNDTMNEVMWGIPWFTTPGVLGLLLSLPLVALTLWRAGLARWWALVPVVAGLAAFTLSGITWWGCAITTVCFAGFAVVLHRATASEPARA